MLKITVKNNVKFPTIDLKPYLFHIADQIIITDLILGIDNQRSIDGGMLPNNEPETVMKKAGGYVKKLYTKGGKQRKGFEKVKANILVPLGSGRPLVDTGKLISSFYSRSGGKNKVIVSISSGRKEIGGYLQGGITTKHGLKQYLFFGISKNAEEGALEYMRKEIQNAIDNPKQTMEWNVKEA